LKKLNFVYRDSNRGFFNAVFGSGYKLSSGVKGSVSISMQTKNNYKDFLKL
jgi:hypothetical protein